MYVSVENPVTVSSPNRVCFPLQKRGLELFGDVHGRGFSVFSHSHRLYLFPAIQERYVQFIRVSLDVCVKPSCNTLIHSGAIIALLVLTFFSWLHDVALV